MATTSDEPIFVDTNVLVYAVVPTAPHHSQALDAITRLEGDDTELWVSRQVLREFLAFLTRPQPFSRAIPAKVVTTAVRKLERRFLIAEEDSDATAKLLSLMEQVPVGGKQVHDANIVATMLTAGIRHLLTYNLEDFDRFKRLDLIEPMLP